jgi:hypothetical protein
LHSDGSIDVNNNGLNSQSGTESGEVRAAAEADQAAAGPAVTEATKMMGYPGKKSWVLFK